MPLVPSFHAYAPKADLAQAYLGGQRIAQEAAADAARISLGYAGLQQRAVEAQMESQAREKAIQAQSMRAMQENEFTKAYHDAQLGIAQNRLQNQEQVLTMRLNQAKEAFEQRQAYERLVKSGVPATEAMQRVGFGQPGFSPSLTPRQPQTIPAAAKSLRYRNLERQLKEIDDKYPGKTNTGITPEDRKRVEEIHAEMDKLSTLPDLSQTAPSPRQWVVDPNTIPAGTPQPAGPPSWFIGNPSIPQAQNVTISPSAWAGMGIGAPAAPAQPFPPMGSFIGSPGGPNLFMSSTPTGGVTVVSKKRK